MKLLSRVLDLVAPYDCLMCGREGSLLCDWCAPDAFMTPPSACFGCGVQMNDFAVCVACRRKTPLKHLWYTAFYETAAKQIIQALKFEQKRPAAEIIAAHLHENLPFFENVVVVPIPTAPLRVRQRGFDHTKLIAKEFARLRNLPYTPVIVRRGNIRQVGQSRSIRAQQMNDAFRVKTRILAKNRPVLLIDDVVTTGATLGAAARTLKRAGYNDILAATFALSRLK